MLLRELKIANFKTMMENNTKSDQSSTILLVNFPFDINKLKKTKNDINPIIITFDYTSHKILVDNKIEHDLSDNFLTSDDVNKIQQNSYDLTKWYNHQTVSKLLEYDGINIGGLFYVEFHYFLLPFLKRFTELIKIYKKYNKKQFIATFNLYNIAKSLNSNTKSFDNDKKQEDFLYDNIKFPVTSSFNLSIKRSHYQYLKKISEKIIQKLIGEQNLPKHAILLAEFDPIRYENLLTLSSKFGVDFVLFNRRRPAIWNSKSYSIIKKSKIFVATDHNLVDSQLHITIKNKQQEFIAKLGVLWENDDYFRTFFSLDSSFWDIIKSNFKNLCEKRILEAIREIEISKELLLKHNIRCVVIWSESGFNEQIIISLAKKLSIKTVLLQHGIIVDEPQTFEFNKFSGILPTNSDKYVVWGEIVKEYAVTCGIPAEKIHALGSPSYDKIKKKHSPEKNAILLAVTAPRKIHIEGYLVKELENYERMIETICKIVYSNNKKLIIKTHPFQEEYDITELVKKTNSSIKIVKRGDIPSVVESCDSLISVSVSSAIFETQLIGKPVISIPVPYDIGNPQILRTNSCLKTTIDDLPNALSKLDDEKYRNNVVENASKLLSQNLAHIGHASEELLSFLKKLTMLT